MISDPYKYRSYWKTEDIFKDYFTPAQVDTIMSEVAVLPNDPVSPVAESAWILRQGNGNSSIPNGVPMGLLLALTYTNDPATPFSYQFSYRDRNGVTNRLPIV